MIEKNKSIIKKKVAIVIGAGAFGTAMAQVLSSNFETVILKVRSLELYQSLLKGENQTYLPGMKLASNIKAALEWEEIDLYSNSEIELIVSALPTNGILEYFKANHDRFLHYLISNIPILSLSKGIDTTTLELSDDLFFETFPNFKDSFCFLSGPSFAHEIMKGQITVVSVAGRSKKNLEKMVSMVNTNYFKVIPSYDVKGVLLGGALKNVLAIASGIIEGLGYNHNTRAALITHGISEMLRFGIVYNARSETFYGPSGVGDLILTTSGELSRNKSFGLELSKGKSPLDLINSRIGVVEGYKTALATQQIALNYSIFAPIFNGVYRVLYEDISPLDIMNELMKSSSKF